jgi:hypothetical protein
MILFLAYRWERNASSRMGTYTTTLLDWCDWCVGRDAGLSPQDTEDRIFMEGCAVLVAQSCMACTISDLIIKTDGLILEIRTF